MAFCFHCVENLTDELVKGEEGVYVRPRLRELLYNADACSECYIVCYARIGTGRSGDVRDERSLSILCESGILLLQRM